MRKLLFFVIFILLAFSVLARTMPAASATNAVTRLPIKGTMESVETYQFAFPRMSVTAHGTGNAIHLGLFNVSYEVEVNLLDFSASEKIRFTTPNGDVLEAQGVGQAVETSTSNIFNLVGIYTITGGTGQFGSASGTITINRAINIMTGFAVSNINGYILIP